MKPKKGLDLSQLGKTQNRYLTPPKTEDSHYKDLSNNTKSKKKSAKGGRPMIGKEPLTAKITVNISATENRKINDKLKGVPVSAFIRNILKDNNII